MGSMVAPAASDLRDFPLEGEGIRLADKASSESELNCWHSAFLSGVPRRTPWCSLAQYKTCPGVGVSRAPIATLSRHPAGRADNLFDDWAVSRWYACPRMTAEREGPPNRVTEIRLNLAERSVTFDVEGRPAVRFTLGPEGLTLQRGLGPLEPETAPMEEARRTVTLTGRLTAKPRQGKADRSGNPTAYARFAAHVEGEDHPHDYIATFHRHTARIALSLERDARITVEGYPHPSGSEKRLDTLSVVNVLNWPRPSKPTDQSTLTERGGGGRNIT